MVVDARNISRLQWLQSLDISKDPEHVRKSSIICTLGPKTQSVEMITELRKAGMNVARMNFSHGSHEFHGTTIANVRRSEEIFKGRPVAIALDTKGPEIRTGNTKGGVDIPFKIGHEMIFSMDPKDAQEGSLERLYIDYHNLPKVVAPGRTIYMDDGIMAFEVLEVQENAVKVVARTDGALSSHKGVNLPGSNVDLPALSDKDKSDLTFGVEQGVDIIFASFIRTAQDVKDIRNHLGEKGKYIKIVVKIESTQGVENFDEILAETDGVMIARGDLGIEIPAAQVFIVQKMITAKCNIAGKPVICATQMLESMTYNPRPTRAEVSDVSNAVLDGADCVMLSGETAKGNYPLHAVRMMGDISLLAESAIAYPPLFNELRASVNLPVDTTEATCSSAANAALEQDAKAIICITTTGTSARMLSKYRPSVPILVVTRDYHTARQVHLSRGCYPFHYQKPKPAAAATEVEARDQWQNDVDERIQFAIANALDAGLLQKDDVVISIQGWRGGVGNTNTMRILRADIETPALRTGSAASSRASTPVPGSPDLRPESMLTRTLKHQLSPDSKAKASSKRSKNGVSVSRLQTSFAEIQGELKRVLDGINSGRILESFDILTKLTDAVVVSCEALGLASEAPVVEAFRRDNFWKGLNKCWLLALQNVQAARSDGDRLRNEHIVHLQNSVVRWADALDQYGLVDYEMGFWESDIMDSLDGVLKSM
ncbi:Pyruvate kinase [Coemansia erecta]|uniref:Pyruvate kinase n=1 Tax=Coemansia erecta TaxID=147472 RepID=A0A9W7Y792_9FUNG|nr:Pyruvate kinase [Coemansia erecta]